MTNPAEAGALSLTARAAIRKIAYEYEVWTALVAMGHRGTWPRERFESHLDALVEEIGEDEEVIMQEAHAEAVRIGKGTSDV